MYVKYDIKDTQKFEHTMYEDVKAELSVLIQSISHIESNYKSLIVISYLKDHAIRINWVNGNNPLVRAITSRSNDTAHIEALFQGSRNNKTFQNDFEAYITGLIQTTPI